jgi:formylglycine-generating enzyme required for sulfatase activity
MAEYLSDPGASDDPVLRALLTAVPEDTCAAFVLADYLEERDDPGRQAQGELLRLVYTLTRSAGGDGRARQEDRMRALLRNGVQAIGPFRRLSLGDQVSMDFAWVPPGVFLMGSPEDEEGRAIRDDERPRCCLVEEGPRHEVMLTRGFWMGTTPVTQLQYTRVVGHNPSWDSNKSADVEPENRDKPVQEVEWYDAVRLLRRLSRRFAGVRFRLPTEAEWEYACRAGTTTRFWSGDTEADLARVGWYYPNTQDAYPKMRPVGKMPANGFGLCDMHGNVWEWCADRFDESYYARSPKTDPRCKRGEPGRRVVRGGDAWDDAAECRSAARDDHAEDCSHNDIGFRVVAEGMLLAEHRR